MITGMPELIITRIVHPFVCVLMSILFGCNPEAPAVKASDVRTSGIDVSRYQGDVAWKEVAESGITFALAKATQGTSYADPKFSKNWEGMKREGIIRGAYHFLTPDEDGAAQARHFISVVHPESGDLPTVVDVERIGKHSNADLVRVLLAFRDEIQQHHGHEIMIYVSPAFWTDHLEPHLPSAWTGPLWIAEYEVKEPKLISKISDWSIWQHSNTGRCKGIKGNVDLNIARNIDSIRIP